MNNLSQPWIFVAPNELTLEYLNSEETTQLRRKATWEKGPTIEPRTRDLRPNTEFQPRKHSGVSVNWQIRGDVEQRNVTSSVARVAETPW